MNRKLLIALISIFSTIPAFANADTCDVTYSKDGFYYVQKNGQTMGDGNSELRTILGLRKKLVQSGVCAVNADSMCGVTYVGSFYYVVKNGQSMSDGYEDVNRALAIRQTLLDNNVCK